MEEDPDAGINLNVVNWIFMYLNALLTPDSTIEGFVIEELCRTSWAL